MFIRKNIPFSLKKLNISLIIKKTITTFDFNLTNKIIWKEKLGNYLIGISKYFLTGVFVASLIKDLAKSF